MWNFLPDAPDDAPPVVGTFPCGPHSDETDFLLRQTDIGGRRRLRNIRPPRRAGGQLVGRAPALGGASSLWRTPVAFVRGSSRIWIVDGLFPGPALRPPTSR